MDELIRWALVPSLLIGLVVETTMLILHHFPSTRHLVVGDPKIVGSRKESDDVLDC